MARKKEILKKRIAEKKAALSKYEEARLAIISGGQSYSIKFGDDSRSLTFADLNTVNELIDRTEEEIEALEERLSGDGLTTRAMRIGGTWR